MTNHNLRPTVDVPEAAKLMGVHPRTVMDLIHDCTLPAAKLGRKWILNTQDVLNHVENEIVKQTAQRMRSPISPRILRKPASNDSTKVRSA